MPICDAVEIIGIVPEVMCPTIVVYDSAQPDSEFNGRYYVTGRTVDFDKERPNAPVYFCKTCNIEPGAEPRKIYWRNNEPMMLVKGWCIGYYFAGTEDLPVEKYCSMSMFLNYFVILSK